ncbi:MAG: SurA N-terminal domain-containing protein [Endomicrobium sp.]|jgi:parvulin-like peptidyl-prolyl isomerase|nr:SurA N-terminal domain-containing protein [Endomicrobium sp.]
MSKRSLVVLIMTAVMAASVFAASEVGEKTLAVVNGEPIFTSDFNNILLPVLEQYRQSVPQAEQNEARVNEIKDAVLNQKIEEVLLKQEVKKQKIKVSKKEIQEGVDQVKKRFPSEADFNAELKKENISAAEFEKRLADQLTTMKLVRQSVESKLKVPMIEQVQSFYDKVLIKMKGGETGLSPEEDVLAANVANYLKRASGEQVRLRQIYINCPKGASSEEKKAALARVENVKKAIKSGEAFADVATKYSEDSVSKTRGGDLGIVVKGDLLPEIDKKVFSMTVGDYTKEPVQTDTGYHFLRVEEKRANKDVSFDEVKNEIGELLYQSQARQAYADWINGLKSKANITTNKIW